MSPRHPVDPVDDRAEAAAPESPSRRRFVRNVGLGAAALGAAAATGGALAGVASAQTSTELPDLDAADISLVQFLQSISLAGQDGLDTASDHSVASQIAEDLRAFARHHGDHAAKFADLIPEEDAVTEANPTLLGELDGKVAGAGDEAALLAVLLEFEEQVAATMLEAMGQASSWVVAEAVASVLPVVGQQAAAIGSVSDTTIGDWLPAFGSTDGALSPDAYPAR